MAARLAYTIPEAAAAVGLSERTIRDAIRRGDIAPRYLGSKPIIPAEELHDWLLSLPTERKS